MSYEYEITRQVRLREAGKDEKWLQELITNNPTILGFGDVVVVQRERSQPTGGRIDLILSDPEENIRYETEIMLGTVDESHIIRTIEYWDVERRRYPAYEHRAVIVAEEITNRFFNVIGLLNKAIPIVALQLNAHLSGDKLHLSFIRVLDVMEEGEEEIGEQVNRATWEDWASELSIKLMDDLISLVPKDAGSPRVTYNRSHVALGTSGTNFGWFHPRRSGHVHFHLKVGEEVRESVIQKLQEKGIECGPHRKAGIIRTVVTSREFNENRKTLEEIMTTAELQSR